MIPFRFDKKYKDGILNDKLAFPCLGGGLFDFLNTEKILDINSLLVETTKKLQNSDKKKYKNSNKKLIPASKSKKYK